MRKFYQTEKFKRLNAVWKKKLEATGFVDLEDSWGYLKHPDERTLKSQNAERIRTFFSLLDEYLLTAVLSKRDRAILELYAQGCSVKGESGIARRLGIGKTTVHRVIRACRELLLSRQR
jgi:DNA-binding NarL/FixJ family response regulator